MFLDLEPIVITKSKINNLKTYSLEFNNLRNLPFNSALEALSILPVDLQSRSLKGNIQTDLSLRGSNFQGVLFLLDGQRINDPQTGHHNSDLPLTKEDIESISVMPGIGSSLFGPDAIGGAVNIQLKKPRDQRMVLETSGGSHNTADVLFSTSAKIVDALGVRLSVERQESGGFRYDKDFKKFISDIATTWDIADGEFNTSFGYEEKEFGAYDFYTPGLGYPSKEWTKTYLFMSGLDLNKEGFIIKPNFLWRRHYDKFMLDKTQIRSTYLNHHRTDLYTPNIYFQKETEILGRTGLGLEYGQECINSTNLGKNNRNHKSVFVDNSKDLTNKFSLGLSYRTDDFDGFDYVYTGSANFRYRLSGGFELYSGISRSIRIPSFTELYYNDPTTLGNTGLSVDESLNYQIGYDCKKERLSLGTTFFLRREKDFIDWVKRSPNQTKWQAENITDAEVSGVENYFKLKIDKYINLDSNYTYIDRRISDYGYLYKYGQNYIRHLINATFSLSLPFGVQTLGFTYKKKPNRDGWSLLNTRLSFNLNKYSQIFLNITNLLNVECQEIEGIPQPGRWIEAGIRLEW